MDKINVSTRMNGFLVGLAALFFLTANAVAGEPQTCGNDKNQYQHQGLSLTDNALYFPKAEFDTVPTILYRSKACYLNTDQIVKVRIVDLTKTSAPHELSNTELAKMISELNANFAGAVRFAADSIEHYRLSDADFNVAQSLEKQHDFFTSYYHSQDEIPVLTVFVLDAMKVGTIDTCGSIGNVPDEKFSGYGPVDIIRLGFVSISKNDRCRNTTGTLSSTLTHQMGHIFGLADTDVQFTANIFASVEVKEFVDRQTPYPNNCFNQSDLLCDTPADPGLYDKTNQIHYVSKGSQGDCSYDPSIYQNLHGGATLTDPSGADYEPNVGNIMSETFPSCMKSFTPQQLQVIKQSSQSILCGKDQDPVPGLRGFPKILIYPNPVVGGKLHISITENAPQPARTFDVTIYDMAERIVKKTVVLSDGNVMTIPLHVSTGVYVVRLKSGLIVKSYRIVVK